MAEGIGLSDILTTIQNGVSAANNLTQILTQATINSSSLQVGISSTFYLTASASIGTGGTVTTVNTSIGLTGGPITTSGTLAVSLSALTNSISSDFALNNISSYFDGPSVNAGTSGVWFASGTVTVTDTSIARIFAKLWDGTTVADSAEQRIDTATGIYCMSLSGVLTNPSSNIKISCRDVTNTTGKILANDTGNAKDSTITVIRIG